MFIKEVRGNRAIVWDNYKAGVVELESGNVIIPIRFDEIHWRIRSSRSPGPGIPPPIEMVGFACFTDEGDAQAYDFDGNKDDWKEWEANIVCPNPERPTERSIEEIEKDFLARYHIGIEREEVEDLLLERRSLLNYEWKHTPENTKRISAINDRLNDAVREALRFGEEAEEMVKDKCNDWSINVEIYPEWEDTDDDICIQNIIAEYGRQSGFKSASPCFTWCNSHDVDQGWDFKKATLDDGVSWDEGPLRRAAYMDCYFLHPFQELLFDNYLFAIQDLLSLKNFYINILINRIAK